MEYIAVLIIALLVFGICFLIDKGFTKLFRSQAQHYSGLSVRLNKRYATIGIIMFALGVADKGQTPVAVDILGIHFQFFQIIKFCAIQIANMPLTGSGVEIKLRCLLLVQKLFVIRKGFACMEV